MARNAVSARVSVPAWLERAGAWSWRLLVVALVGLAALWLIVRLRLLVLPLIVALFAAAALYPVYRFLRERARFPAALASLSVIALIFGVAGGIGWFVVPQLISGFGELGVAAESGVQRIDEWMRGTFGLTADGIGERLSSIVRNNAERIATGVAGGIVTAGEIIIGALLVLVFLFFMLKDGPLFTRWMLGRIPERRRDDARALGGGSMEVLAAYVRGVIVIGLVDASLIGLGLVLIGVPLAGPLIVLTFFGAFIPIVGAFAAGLVAVLVALAANGLGDALLTLAVVVAVQELEGDVVAPVVFGRAVKLHPFVVLVSLTGGAILGGVAGAALAVPLVAVAAAAHGRLSASSAA